MEGMLPFLCPTPVSEGVPILRVDFCKAEVAAIQGSEGSQCDNLARLHREGLRVDTADSNSKCKHVYSLAIC